jgi:N-hydroxyarylamine O-acetyltransferase
LRLEAGAEQTTPHETCRLVQQEDGFDLQARLGDQWANVYRFSLEPQQPVDYEVSNWFTATHPNSIFVQHLIVARPSADRRTSLLNTEVTIRHKDGRIEVQKLKSVDEIAGALAAHFGIVLDEAQKASSLAPHFSRWAGAFERA